MTKYQQAKQELKKLAIDLKNNLDDKTLIRMIGDISVKLNTI